MARIKGFDFYQGWVGGSFPNTEASFHCCAGIVPVSHKLGMEAVGPPMPNRQTAFALQATVCRQWAAQRLADTSAPSPSCLSTYPTHAAAAEQPDALATSTFVRLCSNHLSAHCAAMWDTTKPLCSSVSFLDHNPGALRAVKASLRGGALAT